MPADWSIGLPALVLPSGGAYTAALVASPLAGGPRATGHRPAVRVHIERSLYASSAAQRWTSCVDPGPRLTRRASPTIHVIECRAPSVPLCRGSRRYGPRPGRGAFPNRGETPRGRTSRRRRGRARPQQAMHAGRAMQATLAHRLQIERAPEVEAAVSVLWRLACGRSRPSGVIWLAARAPSCAAMGVVRMSR